MSDGTVQGSPQGGNPTESQLDAETQALMAKKGWKSAAEAVRAYAEAERRMTQATTDAEARKKALEAWELWDNDLNAPVAPGQVAQPQVQPQAQYQYGGPSVDETERQRQYRQNFGWTMPYGVAEEQYPILAAVSDMMFAQEQRFRAPIEQEKRWDKQKRGLRSKSEFGDFSQFETDVDALHDQNPAYSPEDAYWIMKGRRSAQGASQPAAPTPSAADVAARERAARAMSSSAELAGATQSRGIEPDTLNVETVDADKWRADRIRAAGDARYNLQSNIPEGSAP